MAKDKNRVKSKREKRREQREQNRAERQNQHGSVHHIVPQSRGGPDYTQNKLTWSKKAHLAWHALFYNMLPSEALALMLRWINPDGSLNSFMMSDAQIVRWRDIFGDQPTWRAIEWVARRFLPVEHAFFAGKLSPSGKEVAPDELHEGPMESC